MKKQNTGSLKSLFLKFRAFLSNSYKQPVQSKDFFWIALGVGCFVAIFLLLFQPFGFANTSYRYKYWIISGFGLVTFVVILIVGLLIYPFWFGKRPLTLWENILWDIFILVMIGTGNYGYMLLVFGFRGWSFPGFGQMMFFTVLVGLFPTSFLILYQYILYLQSQKMLAKAGGEDLPPIGPVRIYSGQTKDYFEGDTQDLAYLEASDNYVILYYLQEDTWEQKLLRVSLQDALRQIPAQHFFQCHRSFVVNLLWVEALEGNSQKMQIRLKGRDTLVPVSRRRQNLLKQALGRVA